MQSKDDRSWLLVKTQEKLETLQTSELLSLFNGKNNFSFSALHNCQDDFWLLLIICVFLFQIEFLMCFMLQWDRVFKDKMEGYSAYPL